MFKIIFVIIGTIIGAGFASGKEIFTFFNVYGFYGLFGLFFSNLIIGFSIYKSFKLILKYNINSYHDFISILIPKSSFLIDVMCNIINIFLIISFVVMIAGFGSYFFQEFSLPVYVGSCVIAFLSFFVFCGDIELISKINSYIIPFLIILIILLGCTNLFSFTSLNIHSVDSNFNWFIRSLLYSSYNLVVLFPILITLKKYIPHLRNVKIISVLSTTLLSVMSIVLFFLLNYYFEDVFSLDLPTVYIAGLSNLFIKYIFSIAILGAIFTTALSSGYGFLNNLNIKNSKSYKIIALTMCFMSILFSNIGFSTLLNLLYPILGFIRLD